LLIVKLHEHRFGIAGGVGIDLLITGSGQVLSTVGKARPGMEDTMYLLEEMLYTPETASGEIYLLHRL
jgi:hypothetical protein